MPNHGLEMREDVLVHQIMVKRPGERVYFSVNLPRNAQRIVGVEAGLRFSSTASAIPKPAGLLQLQIAGAANHFYSAEPVAGKTGITEPSFPTGTPGFHAPSKWMKDGLVHTGTREPDPVLLTGQRTIYGCYRNYLGLFFNKPVTYTLTLCLWLQFTDKATTNDP